MAPVQVTEPLTYAQGAPRSFFRDLIAAAMHDEEATKRLVQHQREMDVELDRRAGKPVSSVGEQDIEYRTHPNSSLGHGGEFDVPLWLVDRFATAGRAGRPLADLCDPMVLPAGVVSVHTPKITLGNLTAVQVDGGAVSQQDITTADANSNVVTIAGQASISQQLFDQSPIDMDAAFFLDLTRDYNRKLENQLLYGSGVSGNLLGLANVAGIPAGNLVSGTAVTTIATQWPALGQVAANVGNNRLLPAQYWLVAPRRWFWIASSVDSSNRPIASPGQADVGFDAAPRGGSAALGVMQGLVVYGDGAIPAGASPDDAFAVRPDDYFLWESTPRTIAAINPLAGNLQILLSLHRYVAFIGSRYPTGIGMLSAMPGPANF